VADEPSGTPSAAAPVAAAPAAAAPAAPAATAPVTAAPAPVVAEAAPAAPAVAAPVEAAKPVESAAPAADAKAPDAAKPPETPASLLSDAGKPAPVDPAAQADGEPAPAATEPAQAPAPTYETFKLPDGVSLGEKELVNFTGLLGEFETGAKADHAQVQEFGQKLVDLYVAEVQTLGTRLQQRQVEVWNDQNAQWVDQVRSDPEIGGNRIKTTLNIAGSVIEQYGGNAQQIAELRQAFNTTGAGNHPSIVRLLHNIGKALGEGRPVPAQKPAPAPAGKAQRRYAGNTGS
jgi:hypothetical protein